MQHCAMNFILSIFPSSHSPRCNFTNDIGSFAFAAFWKRFKFLHCVCFIAFHFPYRGFLYGFTTTIKAILLYFYFWIRIIAFWWAKIKKNNKNWKFPRSYNTARWNSYSVRFVEHAIIWMMQIKNLIILSLIEFNWNYE